MRDPFALFARVLRTWARAPFRWTKAVSLLFALAGGLLGFILAETAGAVAGFAVGGIAGFAGGWILDRRFA